MPTCGPRRECKPLLDWLAAIDWDGRWADAPRVTAWLGQLIPTKTPGYWPCDLTAQRIGRPPAPVTTRGTGSHPASTGGDPCVIGWDGRLWIYDGCTRVAGLLRAGHVTATVRLQYLIALDL